MLLNEQATIKLEKLRRGGGEEAEKTKKYILRTITGKGFGV